MAGHGQGAFWGLVRSINQGGMPDVTAVPIYNIRDKDGNLGSTPAGNAAAAQAHGFAKGRRAKLHPTRYQRSCSQRARTML